MVLLLFLALLFKLFFFLYCSGILGSILSPFFFIQVPIGSTLIMYSPSKPAEGLFQLIILHERNGVRENEVSSLSFLFLFAFFVP